MSKQKTILPSKPAFKRKKKKPAKAIPKPKQIPEPIENPKLTTKQERFCHEYCLDSNGGKAAIRAGYSAKTADSIASQLLKKLKIKEYIDALHQKRNEKLEISAERTLLEIARLAYFDPQKMFDSEGKLIPIHKLDKDTAACIGGIDVYQKYVGESKEACLENIKKFKIWDKNAALEKMAKYFGKTFEHTGDDAMPVSKRIFFQVEDARKQPPANTEEGAE